ncbi:oxysterol-binding protein-related protein 11 [Anopheles bellator]|uniref:oxysterol-binding protein-related protein 11 n=1 Tax=Anopheles bellator TaxID=139047 RepID=UPI0026477719|nr:oxysterol-binding protein-related protein 11 [Anopheles bellator]
MESNLNKVLNMNRQQLSGQLYKYTNVVKGWQYRWFSVDAQGGMLSYYLPLCEPAGDDSSPQLVGNVPRGQVHLAGAVICPSDEDSKTFTVNCASGDMMKLRAGDARARQEWVDGLRAVVESHSNSTGTALPPRDQLAAHDAFGAARQQLQQTELSNAALARAIENLTGPPLPTDPDLLVLKALSAANTHCLLQCLGLLQRHHELGPDARLEQSF